MTTLNIKKVGLVAHYSEQGDWAFNVAFEFAKSRNMQLNIFYFAQSSFKMPHDLAPKEMDIPSFSEDYLIAEEKKLREYYDDRLGDYIDVGFKVCESVRHNFELHSCLMKQEFNILFVPYLYRSVPFGNMSIEEFAFRFHAPTILVGPSSAKELHVNPPANLIVEKIPLAGINWIPIEKPEKFQELAVL